MTGVLVALCCVAASEDSPDRSSRVYYIQRETPPSTIYIIKKVHDFLPSQARAEDNDASEESKTINFA